MRLAGCVERFVCFATSSGLCHVLISIFKRDGAYGSTEIINKNNFHLLSLAGCLNQITLTLCSTLFVRCQASSTHCESPDLCLTSFFKSVYHHVYFLTLAHNTTITISKALLTAETCM